MIYLKAEQVEWITNDNGELGVKIGEQFFFLYKGHSLVYESGLHDDGTPMHWRPVGKREFGECAHPINHNDYSKIGTVSLGDSDLWKQIAATRQSSADAVDTALAKAIENITKAVKVNDTDTMGMITPDWKVIWSASASWSGPEHVTIGDLRAIAAQGGKGE